MGSTRRFVVTGLGHSGTGFAARLFSLLGHACGHERWFNPRKQRLGGNDSSWLAVPFVADFPAATRVVHLVRDPLRVAQSYARQENEQEFRWTAYYEFARRWCPEMFEPETVVGRVLARVVLWDDSLFGRDVLRVRVEDCQDPEVAADMVEWATGRRPGEARVRRVLARLGTDVNAHARDRPEVIGPGDVRGTPVEQRAIQLGYGAY